MFPTISSWSVVLCSNSKACEIQIDGLDFNRIVEYYNSGSLEVFNGTFLTFQHPHSMELLRFFSGLKEIALFDCSGLTAELLSQSKECHQLMLYDDTWSKLHFSRSLNQLTLRKTNVPNLSLFPLRHLNKLKKLYLTFCNIDISEFMLESAATESLEKIALPFYAFSDQFFEGLRRFKKLRILEFEGYGLLDQHLLRLKSDAITEIVFYETKINASGIVAMIEVNQLPNLKSIVWCTTRRRDKYNEILAKAMQREEY